MAGPIRSICFARGILPADAIVHPVYVVPDGFVLIVKNISLTRSAPGTESSFAVWISNPDQSVNHLIANVQLQVNTPVSISDWWVLNAQDVVRANAATLAGEYWMSGALLPFAQYQVAAVSAAATSAAADMPLPVGFDPSSATPRSPISI